MREDLSVLGEGPSESNPGGRKLSDEGLSLIKPFDHYPLYSVLAVLPLLCRSMLSLLCVHSVFPIVSSILRYFRSRHPSYHYVATGCVISYRM